jgi:hypothetical protein
VWEVVEFDWPFPLRELADSVRVMLKSHHMQPEPIEIRAFVNQPDASARTKTIGNPAFAGAVAFFGHGTPDPHGEKPPAQAPAGHGSGHDVPRPPVQAGVQERFDLELNITNALRMQTRDSTRASLKLVAVDAEGNQVPAEKLILEEIIIELE